MYNNSDLVQNIIIDHMFNILDHMYKITDHVCNIPKGRVH